MTDDDTPEADAPEFTANRDFDLGLRMGIASQLGSSAVDDRDRYDAFGWPKQDSDDLDDEFYYAMYLRNGYAQTVTDKPAKTTWRVDPHVRDDDSEFEEAADRLAERTNLWQFAARTDRVAGIGEHGLLLLGFEDVVGEVDTWATDAREASLDGLDAIRQYKPVGQWQITDVEWGAPGTERWGLPVEYLIDLDNTAAEGGADQETISVHWTRAVDIPAQRPLDDETLARPRIEAVLNNLIDIEKAIGATAESAYRGADYGLHLNADPNEVDPSGVMGDDFKEELERYEHGLQRYLRTVGMEVNRLGGEVADPSGIVEVNIDEISAVTGIPKQELRGNEQGSISGSEVDQQSYFGIIEERQQQFATPYIVKATLDRLQAVGVLPEASNGAYRVEWPDLTTTSAQDVSEIQANRASAVQALQMVAPSLRGEAALEYVATGEFPDLDDDQTANIDVDESDPAVRATFDRLANVEAEADD